MVTILISLFMFVLLVVSGLMTVIILMQKPSANAGMGAALGGGAAESVFGGEASGQLLKFTIRIAVAFFVISFLLYMSIVAAHRPVASNSQVPSLKDMGVALPVAPAASSKPAATSAAAPQAASTAASSSSK